MRCTNSSDCNKGVACSWDHVVGKEYCNASLLALRDSCGYILSCEPAEACNANNECSLIPDGTVDPVTGKPILSYLKIPTWWLGILLNVGGEVGNMLAYGLAKGNCYLSFRSKAEFVKVYHKLLLHLAEAPADGAFRLDDANFYEQMYLVRHQPPPRLPVPQI